MERPSFTRQSPDVVFDEKPKGFSTGVQSPGSSDSKENEANGYKGTNAFDTVVPAYHDLEDLRDEDLRGHLNTAEDIVTTVIHVEDDPTLNPWTFRMFFIGMS
jgi:hypothetical protein